jgi:hypothetical protein
MLYNQIIINTTEHIYIMTETVIEKPLAEQLEAVAQARASAAIELYTAYKNISERAKNGGYITADDFIKAENRYNQLMEPIEKSEYELLNKKTRSKNETADIKANYVKEYYKKIVNWENSNPEIINGFNDVKFMDEAFQRQYLAFPTKNLSLPANTETPQQLITALLKNNDGIAIGDIHSHTSASMSFISDNIKTFKKARVDTIYIEMEEYEYKEINQLSTVELKTRLNARTPDDIKADAQELAKHYGVKEAGDAYGDTMRLFLAAKENGIRIANIDKQGPIRNFEATMRSPSTNFIWTENIISDRKNAEPGSKYIVWGGAGHFTNSIVENGLVDERLGIPLIAFDSREKDAGKPLIIKGDSPNGADFYLPGGNCYPDLPTKFKVIDNARAESEALLNNKPDKAKRLGEAAAKYMEQFLEKDRECYPVEDVKTPKPPPAYTPSSTPLALRQGAQKYLS